MNIKFIDFQLDLVSMGGSMYSLDTTASNLVNFGYEVSIITLQGRLNKIPNKKNYSIIDGKIDISNPLLRDLGVLKILMKYSKDTDIFHIYDPTLFVGGVLYRMLGGDVPVILTLNSYIFCTNFSMMDDLCYKYCNLFKRFIHSPKGKLIKILNLPYRCYQQLFYPMINKIDKFVAISPWVKNVYAELGLDKEKIIVIPQPVKIKSLISEKRRDANFDILYIGRLEYAKGVDLLLKACSMLNIPKLKIHIVGTGSERKALGKLSRKLNIEDRVIFYEYVDNEKLYEFYSRADLFVHPARWPEPLGRTIIEAMNFGLPLIVSDIGGPRWISKGASLIFKSGDVVDLSKKILTVYENKRLTLKLSKNALKRAYKFNYEKIIHKFIEMYRRVKNEASS